jgi:Double-GTPase 2
MKRRCANVHCFVHEGESCPLGRLPADECEQWQEGTSSTDEKPAGDSGASAKVPWSGGALGMDDMFNLFSNRRPIVIAVVGAHDTGKTTLLLGTYLSVIKGNLLADAHFCGSRTLEAWESIAAWVRLQNPSNAPSFPPHTPRGSGRVPGLLHLALRGGDGTHRDVVFTDAPGEWFSSWAIKEDAEDAAGAQWIADHADAFLIVADSKRLSGAERGTARSQLRQLVERMGRHVRSRPTVLVWTKSEHQSAEIIRDSIRAAVRDHLPGTMEVDSTTNRPLSLNEAVGSAVHLAWLAPRFGRQLHLEQSGDAPCYGYRGHHAQS